MPPTARIFGILWILKLVRYAPAFGLVTRVVRNEARALSGVMVAFLIALLVIATSAYLLEGSSGTAGFDSIPGALWWTIATISTTGYGDVVAEVLAELEQAGAKVHCGRWLVTGGGRHTGRSTGDQLARFAVARQLLESHSDLFPGENVRQDQRRVRRNLRHRTVGVQQDGQ